MKKVNLKELYYYIKDDIEVEVSDDVYQFLLASKRAEHAYREQVRKNKSYYSLDRKDGIDTTALVKVKSPEELFFVKQLELKMNEALKTLPKKQAERIILYFYYDKKVGEIARLQGVASSSVSESIISGLDKLKKFDFWPYEIAKFSGG